LQRGRRPRLGTKAIDVGHAGGKVLRRGDWRRLRRTHVLVDHRTYRIKPGMTQAHLDIYEKYGLSAQSRHLGPPLAYMFAESGDVNTIVHQWGYEDAADRTRRRANMWADPQWLGYIERLNASGYLVEQKTSLMIPTRFCPIKR
jgi:hypothetical protein